jgi:hypothetical protein
MRQTPVPRTLAGLLLVAALLAACADSDAGGAAPSGGSSTTAPTTSPETAPSVPVTPTTTTAPTGGGPLVTATGTIRAGVEPGCTLLVADQGPTYLLFGGDRGRLREGMRVQVTGRVRPDLLSICQEGQPLQVTSSKAAG